MAWSAKLAVTLSILFTLGTAPKAHCPDELPEVTLTKPKSGVAIQSVYYPSFRFTVTDTFYQVKLQRELLNLTDSLSNVVLGVADSVREKLVVDSTWFTDSLGTHLIAVDTLMEQTIWIRILKELKGNIPEHNFVFTDTLIYYPPPLSPITYIGLVDTPFVAFFESFNGSLNSMGIGPVDGCFFEPSGYFIKSGRIHKTGWGGDRTPGVSVSLDALFAGIADSDSTSPFVISDTLSWELKFGYGRTKVRKASPK